MENENEVVCDDPFWTGCVDIAVWHRDPTAKDRPDAPHHLCHGCYEALMEEGREILEGSKGEWGYEDIGPMYDPSNWSKIEKNQK